MDERIEKLQENPVPALGQLGQNAADFIPCEEGSGLRVLFVGNSYTLHRPKPEIGWYNCCGMAASCLEKDYVHQLMMRVRSRDPHAAFAIQHAAAPIERNLEQFVPEDIVDARNWNPDVVILFFGENVPKDRPELPEIYGRVCRQIREYLSADGHAHFFWVGCFGLRPELNEQKQAAAEAYGDPYITLDGISLHEEYYGEFNHPNDRGMEAIASRIWEALQKELFFFQNKTLDTSPAHPI